MYTLSKPSRQRRADNIRTAKLLIIVFALLPLFADAQTLVTETTRVNASDNDAEQSADGYFSTTSSDLELTFSNSSQRVGIRFTGLQIPRGAAVTNAYIQFQVDEVSTAAASLEIRGESADTASAFSSSSDVLSRVATLAVVPWTPPPWPTVGAQGIDQRTPNLAPVIQEIVDRAGWDIGNSLLILVTGSGNHIAESWDGDSNGAPLLHVSYTLSDQEPPNVDAGPDQTITLPDGATLNGSVTDDGLPNPPGTVKVDWRTLVGPGTATIAEPNSLTTTATFPIAGAYTLELSASDGERLSTDVIHITVNSASSAPVLSSFVPTSAQVASVVAIYGSGLSAASEVYFGEVASKFEVRSDSLIVATVPPASLTGAITVKNAYGSTSTTSDFIVIPSPPVLVGAGDISDCVGVADQTATLLDGIPGTVFTTGDHAYDDGTAQELNDCYEPTWGRHKSRTRPALGAVDYDSPDAAPYFSYFGPAAGEFGKGYYSFDIGEWHVIALNSNCADIDGCGIDSPQGRWLREDLLRNPSLCTVAYWASPRFNSGSRHGNETNSAGFWELLYAAGAELVLNGHEHLYERFAPQRPDGTADPLGIREIIVGTGGRYLYGLAAIQPNSEVRNINTHGVIKLTLNSTSYDWEFIPVPGGTFTDQGSTGCHQVNQIPLVDAGPDMVITWPDTAEISGQAFDDSSTFSASWTQISGPGTATFGDSSAAKTTVSFDQNGIYVLRLSGDDGEFFEADDVSLLVVDAGTEVGEIEAIVTSSLNDVEESAADGAVYTTSSDLELVEDFGFVGAAQIIGIRFENLDIPQGATILSTDIQFQVDEPSSDATFLIIRGEAVDDSAGFTVANQDLSARNLTDQQVEWTPNPWPTVGSAGDDQRTPDLSTVIQEIVDRGGWASGNALSIIIEGTGRRVAVSYDGAPSAAPRLRVTYGVSSPGASIDIPDLTGLTQTEAEGNLVAAGLTVGAVTTQSSETVEAGRVISQSPVNCLACASSGDPVDLVVSSGTALIDIPDLTGLTQTEAEGNLVAAGLTVGAVTTQSSETVEAGRVISQSPVNCLACASSGDPVDLVVSSGTALIDIPDLTGLTQTEAEGNLVAAGLTVGAVTTQSSETVEAGRVISQSPVNCLACASSGDPVDLVVSSGTALIDIPDLTGLTQTEAEGNLVAAGLTVGAVTTQSSETVEAGRVISQSPVNCLACASSGDPVDLVVSSGTALIDIPDLTGLTQTEAEGNLVAAGLTVGAVTTQSSETVEAGRVISQSPVNCLACASSGDPVDLVVSSGTALIDIPDLTGLTQTEAEGNLVAAGLTVGAVTTQSSETVEAGRVISQSPVNCLACASSGDPVDLVVSSGTALIDIPDLTGLTQTEAEGNLVAAGLTVGAVTTQSSETVEAGRVISQSPVNCLACASSGDPVDLVVSSGTALIDIPDLTGLTQTEAEGNLVAAGLTVGAVTTQSSETVEAGRVISQSPVNCLACASSGDPVDLVVSSGTALIDIPDLTGLTQTEAEGNLVAAGLTVGAVTTQSSETVEAGRVISQSPVNCLACASSGDPVDLVVSSGTALIDIPDLTGLTQTEAEGNLVAAGLTVGAVTTQSSETVEAGRVISQSPVNCLACASSGDPVDLVVSSGSTPPVVTITAPADGLVSPEGVVIKFSATANDVEDGDLSSDIVWASNKVGLLGTGPTISVILSQGRHTVTARATDSTEVLGSAEIKLRVRNSRGLK